MGIKKLLFNKYHVYDTKFFLYQYNDNNIRIVKQKYCRNSGYEEIKKINGDKVDKDEVERISISRSRRNIRELALCNDFEYFVTLTIDCKKCDRYSIDECQELLRKTLKAYKRKNKDFAYLLITEKHLKGSFHFHGLFKGVDNKDLVEFRKDDFDKLPYYILNNLKKGQSIYYTKFFDEKMGYCTLSKIRDYNKCCNYITKYITQDCIKNSAGTVYISSRGLKKASRYQIVDPNIDYQFENDFCSIKDYNIEQSDMTTLLSLLTITQ